MAPQREGAHAAHGELGDRHEVDQPAVAPVEAAGVHPHLDLSEGQGIGPWGELHRAAVARSEGERDRAIVEIGGQPRLWIERSGLLLSPLRQEEGVRVDSGGEIVGLLPRVLRMQEGEFAEGEHLRAAAASAGDDLTQRAQSAFRVVVERSEQAPRIHRVSRPLARSVRRECVRRERSIHGARTDTGDADRRRAGRQTQQRANADDGDQTRWHREPAQRTV